MELNLFIKEFASQFDDTDESEFSADTVYQELDEWSSLMSMAIIAFVKTKYDKTITGKEVRECETIKELFDLVASK